MHRLSRELDALSRIHRRRALALPQGIDFTSNDYLGLSQHPAIRQAMIAELTAGDGVGSAGSRLLRGHRAAHAELEAFAARFFGVESALFFSTGFTANYALFTCLADRRDAIVYDAAIHASAKEGIHAAHARRYKVPHNDADGFRDAVRRARRDGAETVWVTVEGVYSMDGDIAPLDDLLTIADDDDAVLIIDEAHATGVLGAHGRGLACGQHGRANVISLHTCGKAMGVAGALVCGPAVVIDYLVNAARPFIYSTAPLPAMAAAVQRALMLIDEEPWRRQRLLALAARAQARLRGIGGASVPETIIPETGTQIIPVILGSDERAVATAGAVQQLGYDVRAIRPPTVAAGTARLRLSLSSDRSEAEVDGLAAAITDALAEVPA